MIDITLSRQRIIAYSAIAVLLLGLLGVLGYGLLLSRTSDTDDIVVVPPRVRGVTPSEARQEFNVNVLDHPAYYDINRTLLETGRLPVTPPLDRGKPNLFSR